MTAPLPPGPELTALVAAACERWLGFKRHPKYASFNWTDPARPGFLVNLPAPDGNLQDRLCRAMVAAGFTVDLRMRSTVSCCDVTRDPLRKIHQATADSPFEAVVRASLRAASEMD